MFDYRVGFTHFSTLWAESRQPGGKAALFSGRFLTTSKALLGGDDSSDAGVALKSWNLVGQSREGISHLLNVYYVSGPLNAHSHFIRPEIPEGQEC